MQAYLLSWQTRNLKPVADTMYTEIQNDVNKAVTKMSVVLEVLLKQGEVLPWLSVMYDSELTSKIQ